MRNLLWPCAQGKSLKIPALPSVTTLSFRSHMFLEEQRGPTECNHNIFLSPFLALCGPEMAFSCIWMVPGEHNVMRKWSARVLEMHLSEMIRSREIFKACGLIENVFRVTLLYKHDYILFFFFKWPLLRYACTKSRTIFCSNVHHRHLQGEYSQFLLQMARRERDSWQYDGGSQSV